MKDASCKCAVVGVDAAAFGEACKVSGRAFVGLALEITHPEDLCACGVSEAFEQKGGFVEEGCIVGALLEHFFEDAEVDIGLVVFFGEVGKEAQGFVGGLGLEGLLKECVACGGWKGVVDGFEPREIFPLDGLGEEFNGDLLERETVSVKRDGLGDNGTIDRREATCGLEELGKQQVAFFVEGLELIEHLTQRYLPEGEIGGFCFAQGEGLDDGLDPDFGEGFADDL